MNVKHYAILPVLFGLFLFVPAGCTKKENPFPDHVGGQIFLGLKHVNVKCAGCHGDLGGGGMGGPNLVQSVKTLSPEHFVARVANGLGGMPAFGDVLTEDEILEIMDWLKKLS